jgi:hypothetical protein
VSARRRIALLLVALTIAAAAQMALAQSASLARFGEPRESALKAVAHHDDSAVVPASQSLRGTRALSQLLSVPLVAMLAFVALLAVWFTASVRRRDRSPYAVVTYRRRGPPALPPVI